MACLLFSRIIIRFYRTCVLIKRDLQEMCRSEERRLKDKCSPENVNSVLLTHIETQEHKVQFLA